MQLRKLGRSGLEVTPLCLGTVAFGNEGREAWKLDRSRAERLVAAALDRGINYFDTGNTYSGGESETMLGHALRTAGRRDELVVTSKVFFRTGPGPNQGGLSRKHIFNAIDASLRRLQLDHVDVYMMHRFDPATPPEETLAALDEIVRSGKARYLGASSMPAWRLMQALALQQANGWARFVVMQNHYNLLYREDERELVPLCRELGVGLTPWSPLARGRLAGAGADARRLASDPVAAQFDDPAIDGPTIDAVAALAAARNVAPATVALAWLLQRPCVVAPVIGPLDQAQLDDAVAALALALSDEECALLERHYRPRPVIGHDA